MVEVATLEKVPVRDVWPDEAGDLTPWLAGRTQLLSETLGMDLELVESEMSVGPFRADLVFRDAASDFLVVVENLIGKTDHDHLGKLITYGAGLNANYVVLLAEDFRPEHRTALTWLNTISEDGFGFFAVVLETIRIDDSKPAPHLRVIVEPDDWQRAVKLAKNQGKKALLYSQFWSEFLPQFRKAYPDWSKSKKPPKFSYMGFPSGCSKVKLVACFGKSGRPRVEVYIDTDDIESNTRLFDALHERRDSIEKKIGEELTWDSLEGKKAARISLCLSDTRITVNERDRWTEVHTLFVDALGRMREAFTPHLEELSQEGVALSAHTS